MNRPRSTPRPEEFWRTRCTQPFWRTLYWELRRGRGACLARLIISRTRVGGDYGLHMDSAPMGGTESRMRTNLAFTLFLSDPGDHEGAALAIETPGARQSVRTSAGDLALYPSTTLHEVEPVTAGVRIVCVGWIESLVCGPAEREILFDLENLQAELAGAYSAQFPERLTISNLLRLWAAP